MSFKFDILVKQVLEDFNIYPKPKHVAGSGPNIDFRGPLPTGFKGANVPGIAPDSGEQVILRLPKKKKKKR